MVTREEAKDRALRALKVWAGDKGVEVNEVDELVLKSIADEAWRAADSTWRRNAFTLANHGGEGDLTP